MRFTHRGERNHRLTSEGELLIARTEAFLSGSYLVHLRRRGEIVPSWAWINRIAHGSLESIRDARYSAKNAVPSRRDDYTQSWQNAEGILAIELLDFVDEDAARLSNVQQTVLVPLELRLMQQETNGALTASGLVQSTRAALRSICL